MKSIINALLIGLSAVAVVVARKGLIDLLGWLAKL
jgi:hypothetical protein